MNIDKLQSGDLLFCWRETVLSEGIQAVTQSRFSHVAGVVWEGNTLMVYDSQIDGFTGKNFDDWMKKYKYKFIVMRDESLTNEALANERERIKSIDGKKYDFVSLFIRKPFNIGRKIANAFRRNDKELIRQKEALARVYCSEGWAYIKNMPDVDVTPSELFTDVTLAGHKLVNL